METADKDCPLVLVEWEDSAQPIAHWVYLADFKSRTAVKCASVGWLVYDGDDVKALAPNMGDLGDHESAQASGIIRIPTRCIISVVRLSEKR